MPKPRKPSSNSDLNMDAFKGAMKLSIDGQPSRPFSIDVPRPWLDTTYVKDAQAAEAFKQLRSEHGRLQGRDETEHRRATLAAILDRRAAAVAGYDVREGCPSRGSLQATPI